LRVKSPRLKLRRRSLASVALLLSALTQVSCFSEPGSKPTLREPAGDGGGAATDLPTAGAAGDAPTEVTEVTDPARLGIFHAAEDLPELGWSLTGAAGPQHGSLSAKRSEQLAGLPAGNYTLTLTLADAEESLELELTSGAEVNVVVAPRASRKHPWRAHVLTTEAAPESDPASEAPAAARFFVVNAGAGGLRSLDVGNDGVADGEVEPEQASAPLALDVSRPALAFIDDQGGVTDSFTLPRPDRDTTVLAVLLGDPTADGVGPAGQRLLVAQMAESGEAHEVRADPVLYFVHASARHAGLDLFVSPGNPIEAGMIAGGDGRPIAAFSPDTTVNKRRNSAEVLDNARFGDLRVGRVPPLAATLELYLTIPGDPQLPAALNYNLVRDLLPNQRLRNGTAIGRQGAQSVAVAGELQAGAEYLLVAPSNGLFNSNHDARFIPKVPKFPFERIERHPVEGEQFTLRVATSLLTAGGGETLAVDGIQLGSSTYHLESDPQLLTAGTHQLTVNLAPGKSRTLELEAQPGQDLLVIASGDTTAAPITAPAAPRADDTDGDGAVCSAVDPETQRFLDPNYLPVDGNSELIQDDCPDQPGPLVHQGCPATPLQWLILDLSTRPPTLSAVPIQP
jgi:hypothetical protein